MLIAGADVYGWGYADLRIRDGRISAIGALEPALGETVLNARGGALLPGLHDHHMHLLSFAAALSSLSCGPPAIHSEAELTAVLRRRRKSDPGAWIRGYGYHESVAGRLDRRWLDRCLPDTPTRIQHRSGRLWIFNSAALESLAAAAKLVSGDAVSVIRAAENGRLYDQDALLRRLLGRTLPDVGAASRALARCGVTGITDMTPDNDPGTAKTFSRLQARGVLLQRVHLAGAPTLSPAASDGSEESSSIEPMQGIEPMQDIGPTLSFGATKIHLHESDLPAFETFCQMIAHSHESRRPVAVHCVSETELVYTLAAFRDAGTLPGDRIEHASVTPPPLLEQLRELGLLVVTQPNFVAERGDAYLRDVSSAAHDWLYRNRSFLEQGIPLAGGTDAPFGSADPWYAMRAAVQRRTDHGRPLGPREALSPEQALALFLGAPETPHLARQFQPGGPADLCLLDRSWRKARALLSAHCVRLTIRAGTLIYDRVDEAPVESPAG